MKRRFTFFLPMVLTLAVAAPGPPPAAMAADVLEANGDLQWRRGNMHTHSHWSDGDDYLEMIALWYRDHGYDFLVFTDHNVLADTVRWINVAKSKGGATAYGVLKARFPRLARERIRREGERDVLEVRLSTFQEVAEQFNNPGKFLLIQGEEITDSFETLPIHLNVSNVVDVIPPTAGNSVYDTIQGNIRAAHAQRERTGQPMIIHLNHPNFGYAVTAEDLARLVGERFFEVYNGYPGVHNSGDEEHADTERVWDIALTRRLAELRLPLMYGLATDDSHEYHNIPSRASEPGRAWVMVLTKQLTANALIESLEAGRFYSSSGVTLKRIETSSEIFSVEIEPVEGESYTIEFIGTRKGYDATSQPVLNKEGQEIRATRRYSRDVGETFAKVEGTKGVYRLKGDEIYVRARITSSAKHPNPSELGDPQLAWCQPVMLEGSP